MIRGGFLTAEDRKDLIELARDGSAEHRLGRRASALVLLDAGWSCESVGQALLLDDDTIRTWFRLFQDGGVEGLAGFGDEGSVCRLTLERRERLKAWITETLPRTTRAVGARIESKFGISYQSRSGLVALLHRLGYALLLPLCAVTLAACDPVTMAAVGSAGSLTATKKLPPDHIASWVMGRDCSVISLEATGDYCPDKREIDRSRLYCYKTLGDVDCHERPDLYRNSDRPLASPPPHPVRQ